MSFRTCVYANSSTMKSVVTTLIAGVLFLFAGSLHAQPQPANELHAPTTAPGPHELHTHTTAPGPNEGSSLASSPDSDGIPAEAVYQSLTEAIAPLPASASNPESTFRLAADGMLPIIDMHLHASRATSNGPPPSAICPGEPPRVVPEAGKTWIEVFMYTIQNPSCEHPIWGPETDEGVRDRTLEILREKNIWAVTSGTLLDDYIEAGGERIIPSLMFGQLRNYPDPDVVRTMLQTGKYKVFGEVTLQYEGISPNDPRFAPYLEVLAELDIPLGIHIGTGPPGISYFPGMGQHLARMHSAFEVEEIALRHPGLRIYLMHAGYPLVDDLIAVLYNHPFVYADVGIISYMLPRPEFHRFLERVVTAGYGRRIMFGSDQMNWPDAILYALESIETADFLTFEQKRDILYNNAAHFLQLDEATIARHHGQR